jgi:hypothetical protein
METFELGEQVSWPIASNMSKEAEVEFAKLLYQAQLDEVKARLQAELDELKARWRDQAQEATERRRLVATRLENRVTAEDALRSKVHDAYLEVGKQAMERSLTRASFVATTASALSTIYTGLLALVYSVSGNAPIPMPASGIAPAVFLGISLALSVVYVSYLRESSSRRLVLPVGTGSRMQEMRLLSFLSWIAAGAFSRAWALRIAVISMGVGVSLMPLPFLRISGRNAWQIAAMGGMILLSVAGFELYNAWRRRGRERSPDET